MGRLHYAAAADAEWGEHERKGRCPAAQRAMLTERAVDHIYTATVAVSLEGVNEEEVSGTRYVSQADLAAELAERPEDFTPWLRAIAPRLLLGQPSLWPTAGAREAGARPFDGGAIWRIPAALA